MEKIYMLSVVIEAFKQSVMFLCKPSQIVVCLGFISPCILSSPARLDGIHPVQIHLGPRFSVGCPY